MSSPTDFHSLLFEMSNEIRYEILLSLLNTPKRVSELTKEFSLTTTEIRRHIHRITHVQLIERDTDGYYRLTSYGEMIIILLQEFEFTSKYVEYFASHSFSQLPEEFLKRIGDLRHSALIENVFEFIRLSETTIKEANKSVDLIVDAFPLNYINSINRALDDGIRFRILEPAESAFKTDYQDLGDDDYTSLSRARRTPLVQQRIIDTSFVYMIISQKTAVITFPNRDGFYDYTGFVSSDKQALKWCQDLYEYLWGSSNQMVISQLRDKQIEEKIGETVFIEGTGDPIIDVKSVQDAVNSYEQVVLSGEFNFGASEINITRSVVLRGEGRENDIPSTKIKKQGWKYPFSTYERLIYIRGKDIEVTVENIHFTDFNNVCILAMEGKSLQINKNRFTLETPLGRGMNWFNWGSQITGIIASGNWEYGSFKGETIIKENYIDFGLFKAQSGFYTRKEVENEPSYRPDIDSHDYTLSYGIIVNRKLGKTIIENNTVKNVNSRGFFVMDNWGSSETIIQNNEVNMSVFGSYPFNENYAGYGICAMGYWEMPEVLGGNKIIIRQNIVRCEKVNFCAVAVIGHAQGRETVEGTSKFQDGYITENTIYLSDGAVGVLIDRCDDMIVEDNIVSGKTYYGIQVTGDESLENLDLSSKRNRIIGNNMDDLVINKPDNYSNSKIDNQVFTGNRNQSITSHIWLNRHTENNCVKIDSELNVIDEGKANTIEKLNKT
jgi:predicted transcriptional regulator